MIGSGPLSDAGHRYPLVPAYLHFSEASRVLTEGTPNVHAALGAGAAEIVETVAAAEQTGFAMDTGDEIYWHVPLLGKFPFIDLSRDIHARIVWKGLNAGDANVDWTLHVKGAVAGLGAGAGDAVGDAKSSADGTITFAAATTQAAKYQRTEWGFLSVPGTLADDQVFQAAVTLADRGAADALEIHFYWVEFRYTMTLDDPSGVGQQT